MKINWKDEFDNAIMDLKTYETSECTCYKYRPLDSKCRRCILLEGKIHNLYNLADILYA